MTDDLMRRAWSSTDNLDQDDRIVVDKPRESYFKKVIRHAWDPKTKRVFGRDARSWGLIGAFYFTYWLCLAIFFALLLAFFCEVILDKDNPSLTGYDIPIADNPGLGFRPMPTWDTTLIKFDQANDESKKIHIDHINAFLANYENENQEGRNFIDCPDGKRSSSDPEKVCRFDPMVLGSECDYVHNFGYDDGTPCILLKINRVMGWEPQNYNRSNIPKEVGDRWRQNWVGVTCEGVTPTDKENIGEVEFYPNWGFPFAYFPYTGQGGYKSPLVMAFFANVHMGVVVMVECKIWTANIRHSTYDYENAGSVRFEILAD